MISYKDVLDELSTEYENKSGKGSVLRYAQCLEPKTAIAVVYGALRQTDELNFPITAYLVSAEAQTLGAKAIGEGVVPGKCEKLSDYIPHLFEGEIGEAISAKLPEAFYVVYGRRVECVEADLQLTITKSQYGENIEESDLQLGIENTGTAWKFSIHTNGKAHLGPIEVHSYRRWEMLTMDLPIKVRSLVKEFCG